MRYHIIDGIRGISLISMIIYHMIWDIVYIWGADWKWYQSDGAYIWQQSICWTFILLSGFCWSMGKNKLKRGLITFTIGIMITLITCIFMPDYRIVFGILTLIGSCTLILIVLERILKKIPIMLGMCSSLLLFIVFKSINKGYIGIGKQVLLEIPNDLYQGYLSTYIGFTATNFFSTDYFSLFPWIFLFIVGYFGYQLAIQKDYLRLLQHRRCRLMEYIGQHSLGMYLIHQPVIYSILWACYQIE